MNTLQWKQEIRDRVVGTTTRLRAGWSAVRFPTGATDFSYLQNPDQFWGPPSLLLYRYRRTSPGIKRQEREVNHSPPSSSEVKNEWSNEFTLPVCLLSRFQWPRGLRSRSTAVRLLRLLLRIPPGAWMSVCCECCMSSLRRVDHSSRGVQPTVLCRCV
jgi:hypothetical protein